MKLVVPYLYELEAVDIRLMQLAEFCGVTCDTLSLGPGASYRPARLSSSIRDDHACVVVNASVMKKWLSAEFFPTDLASYLVSRFRFLFVHNLDSGPFATSMLRHFSGGRLTSLRPVTQSHLTYQISRECKSICGVYSGLEFGPVDTVNDRVFEGELGSSPLQTHIAINERPLFVSTTRHLAEVFLLAGRNIVDLGAEEPAFRSLRCFSQLVPVVMFLRHAFREECWRPNARHATLVIDDPLLQERYGFLNYVGLLDLMDRYDFHTSIAFIPRNRFKTSPSVSRIFRSRPDRYSLCVHGNDHTAGELGTADPARLNTLLQTAARRMDAHRQETSIPYDKVMVFPQGVFSDTAMRVLKANNFLAAVNSHPLPHGEASPLRIADYIQPAITGYGGFPLYLRKYVREQTSHDVAFNLFFGQPVLIVEHHTIFKDVDCLTGLVSRINRLAPNIRWSNLQTAVENSFVQRVRPDGALEVLTYAGCLRLTSGSRSDRRCVVVKRDCGDIPMRQVSLNGVPVEDWVITDGHISFAFDLTGGTSPRCSFDYDNEYALSSPRWRMTEGLRVVLRRRASEIRDNYLSKSPALLALAERFGRRLFRAEGGTTSTK